MSRFNTVIFDLDGVVVDSIEVIRNVFEMSYREAVGIGDPPFEEYKKYLGQSLPVILKKMGLPQKMHKIFIEESYRQADRIKPFHGVAEVLEELLNNNIGLGVATGKDGARARSLLDQLGLKKYFGLILGSDEVRNPKPAPDMVNTHLKFFGTEPFQTLMIGDAPSDIKAGKAASVSTAAAIWGDADLEGLVAEKPDYILVNPNEILKISGINYVENSSD